MAAKRRLLAALAATILACGSGDEPTTEDSPVLTSSMDLSLELRDPAEGWVYRCYRCSLSQFEAADAPAGHVLAPPRRELFDRAVLEPPAAPDGVPQSLDLVEALPGDDFPLIARVLRSLAIGSAPDTGVMARASVEREATITFEAGRVVHELTDDARQTFVLITYDLAALASVDLDQVGALAHLSRPSGWRYTSRVLDEPLVITSIDGVAEVLFQQSAGNWQRATRP